MSYKNEEIPIEWSRWEKPEIYSHLNWPVDMEKNTGESSEVAEGKTQRKKLLLFSLPLTRSRPRTHMSWVGQKCQKFHLPPMLSFFVAFPLSTISTRPLVIYRLNCSSKSKKKKRTRSSCDTTGNWGSQTFISRRKLTFVPHTSGTFYR